LGRPHIGRDCHVNALPVEYTQPFIFYPYSPANPGYTADELVHQLSTSKTKIIITHPVCLNTARLAAKNYGLAESQVILIQEEGAPPGVPFLDQLIEFGASKPENYRAVRLKPGEAKTTVAFYSFSSGTSGETLVEPQFSGQIMLTSSRLPGKPKVLPPSCQWYAHLD
jgi:4-coumarate--CoA ligase